MATTFTLIQLTTLETAIAQGTLKVKYADKEVTYRSQAEMLQLRDIMRQELGTASTGSNRRLATFNKGL